MKWFKKTNQKGFTLVETVVAILILSLTVGALLTLTANSIFSVRYARNQIVANNLNQEVLEYVRNMRDTARQQQISWGNWLLTLNVDSSGQTNGDLNNAQGCFLPKQSQAPYQGCIISPYTTTNATIWQMNYNGGCSGQASNATSCPNIWYYPQTGFYSYPSRDDVSLAAGTPIRTTYSRWVNVSLLPSDPNQLLVTATITWTNGITPKVLTQSMILTNWSQ